MGPGHGGINAVIGDVDKVPVLTPVMRWLLAALRRRYERQGAGPGVLAVIKQSEARVKHGYKLKLKRNII